mgnify:CR=1 FL=1
MSKRIRSVGIAIKPKSSDALNTVKTLIEALSKHGILYVLDDDTLGDYFHDNVQLLEECKVDLVISIGGDGTLIYTIHRIYEKRIPVMGVNIPESYGYLSEISSTGIERAIEKLVNGDFTLDKREFIECLFNNKSYLAVNEIMVVSEKPYKTVTLEVCVNDDKVIRGKMDGILIATPLGSTAYSFSAGGPILHPDLKALVLTPVCPVRLFARPMIIPDSHVVKVRVIKGTASVAGDVFHFGILRRGEEVTVKKSTKRYCLLRLGLESYYSKLARSFSFIKEST